jgi:hypothetical protein
VYSIQRVKAKPWTASRNLQRLINQVLGANQPKLSRPQHRFAATSLVFWTFVGPAINRMIVRQHIFPAPRRRPQTAASWLLALWAVLLTGHKVTAQKGGATKATTSQAPQTTTDDSNSDATAKSPQTTDDSTNTTTDDSNNSNSPTTSQQTSTDDNTSKTTDQATSTARPNISSSTSSTTLPQITSSVPLPNLTTALPKLTINTSNLPPYTVTIPPLDGNPYLQTSRLPEGTVFIVVGSCLAGLALVVIFSRAIYIWCLHRQSNQRAKDIKYSALEQRPNTSGTAMSSNPLLGFSGGGNISLDYLRPGDRSSRVSAYSSRPSTARPQTNGTMGRPTSSATVLSSANVQFYSPSAHPGGTVAAALGTQPGSRDSGYLPAGYYLREPSTPNNRDTSPRQIYAAPPQSPTSFFYSDPSTPPAPRLSRPPTSNSVGATGGTGRPSTAASGNGYGGGNVGGYGYNGQTYHTPARRGSSSYRRDSTTGDRRSKPSQVLEEMLGAG